MFWESPPLLFSFLKLREGGSRIDNAYMSILYIKKYILVITMKSIVLLFIEKGRMDTLSKAGEII